VGAAFATCAVAVALAHRRAPSTRKAVAVALLVGAAVAVKSLLVGPAIAIAFVLVISSRRVRDIVIVPVGAAALVVVAAAPFGFQHVVDDYVRYHVDKTGQRRPIPNFKKLVSTLARRDTVPLALGTVGLGALAFGAASRGRRGPSEDEPAEPRDERSWWLDRVIGGDRVLWWWLAAVLVVLVLQDPMFRNHIAAMAAPLSLAVARVRPSWKVVAVVAVVAAPFQVHQLRHLLFPADYTGDAALVVDRIRALPEGAWALSDEPGLVWRAGKGTDPYFVDSSILRIHSDVKTVNITQRKVLDSAANPRVCAVVVWAPVRFGSFAGLPDGLRARGYEEVARFGSRRGLYVRRDCRPRA
jgi:hypothetical protein